MTYFRVGDETQGRDAATGVRVVFGAFAALLGILALWILIAELTSPQLTYFPSTPGDAVAAYSVRDSAAMAAEVGLVRGDLWTVAGVTAATSLVFGATDGGPGQSQADLENARAIADRAARLSPHDPRVWLVLAGLDFRVDHNDPKGTEALKLSYYTGSNEVSLMPLRLLLAVRSNAISDDEVQSLVPLDIQRMIVQRPDLKPAIALAYSNAMPKGREIIEAALKETDPSFLKRMAAPHPGNSIPN